MDPFYLSWKAKEFDFHTRFIELAGEINTAMPYHVVSSVATALNKTKKALNGARVLVLERTSETSTISAIIEDAKVVIKKDKSGEKSAELYPRNDDKNEHEIKADHFKIKYS